MTAVTSEHAPFAPSSLGMLMNCAGSFRMRKLYPDDKDSPAAMEGTAAHWVAAEALRGNWPAVNSLAPNGIAVTEEMLDGADIYLTAVEPYLKDAWIENTVACVELHADCWGTPDFSSPTLSRTVIADFKFGHRHVEVYENWQLIGYAAGSVDRTDDSHEVVLIVVQPRSFHRDGPVRVWRTTTGELKQYWERIRVRMAEALSDDALCTPSPECIDCSASPACEALQCASLSAMDVAKRTIPLELDSSGVSLALRMVRRAREMLKAIESGLEEQAMNSIRSGSNVPGFSLLAGAGREKWSKPVDEVIALGMALGVDVSKPGTITPKQAVKAGLPRDLVTAYSETPSGELKLVQTDEAGLRRVFGVVTQVRPVAGGEGI